LKSFVKTSGGKGFHIHVPIAPDYTWDEVKDFTKTVAVQLSRENPDLFVANVAKAKRTGKIFVDYLRNGYGATSVAPFSVRARAGGAVAMPISWDEVATVASDHFTLKQILARGKITGKDPWKGYFDTVQEIAVLKGSP
jgi:bifunctional non-homologous end joining protein LigD